MEGASLYIAGVLEYILVVIYIAQNMTLLTLGPLSNVPSSLLVYGPQSTFLLMEIEATRSSRFLKPNQPLSLHPRTPTFHFKATFARASVNSINYQQAAGP